jgi:DNA polymerase-3 subunit delta'
MSLKEIFCQDRAIGTLQRALAADRVPHAYIFTGPEGVGKFMTARKWAKLLLCQKPSASNSFFDSCGKCQSCVKFEAGAHTDFHRVYKELRQFTEDGQHKTTPVELPIDVIREFLIDKVASRPTLSQRSVFVVEEAQKLNKESQNAMLKTLEEPPPYCSIILLCTRLEDLLPTTQSRCQIVNFGPIEENVIVDKLQQNGLKKEEARYWARFSQGSLGVAMQWAGLKSAIEALLEERDKEPKEAIDVYKIKRELVERLARYELADAVEFAEWIARQTKAIAGAWEEVEEDTSTKDLGRRVTNGVLMMIGAALNDVMKLNVETGAKLINDDQRRQIGELAKKYDAQTAAEGTASVYKSRDWLEAAVNERLIFDELLLNLSANAIL